MNAKAFSEPAVEFWKSNFESDFGVFICTGKLKCVRQCSAGISFSE